MGNGINIPGNVGLQGMGGVGVPSFDFSNGGNMNQNQGFDPTQIFNGMLGAQQGIPQMLAQNQMGAYNQFGNQMQNNAAQMSQQNNANAGAAEGLAGMRNQANMARMGDATSLASQQLKMPMMAGLLGALTGGSFPGLNGAGGLRGFASTNSPQAASLPGTFGGATGGPAGGTAGGFGGQGLFNAIMGSQPLAPGAFGSSVNVMGALADPIDKLRNLQQQNLSAAMNRGPYGAAGAAAGQVNPANIF